MTAVWRGNPYPLGATWDGQGVNFALYSQHAEKVELCLFDLRTADARSSAWSCASAPISSGTATCPTRVPACCTAIACTGRTPRRKATASTRTSCSSIRTRA